MQRDPLGGHAVGGEGARRVLRRDEHAIDRRVLGLLAGHQLVRVAVHVIGPERQAELLVQLAHRRDGVSGVGARSLAEHG